MRLADVAGGIAFRADAEIQFAADPAMGLGRAGGIAFEGGGDRRGRRGGRGAGRGGGAGAKRQDEGQQQGDAQAHGTTPWGERTVGPETRASK